MEVFQSDTFDHRVLSCNLISSIALNSAMPSDLAKKKAAKKKEAAKARQRTKKSDEVNGEDDQPETQSNGAESNGERGIVLCKVQ